MEAAAAAACVHEIKRKRSQKVRRVQTLKAFRGGGRMKGLKYAPVLQDIKGRRRRPKGSVHVQDHLSGSERTGRTPHAALLRNTKGTREHLDDVTKGWRTRA